jgi:hypothetical protein
MDSWEHLELMASLDYWRLCDELSVIQAACLVVGVDPSSEIGSNCEGWATHERPDGYEAAKAGITSAFQRGAIKGRLIQLFEYDMNGNPCGAIEDSIDRAESRVEVESLRVWLKSRGFRTGFFFPDATDAPDYLDPQNSRYAPKLAAAVRAWQAMEDKNLRRGKSAKAAMEQYLETNYRTLGLAQKRSSEKHGYKAGDINKTAIVEAAKIANWEDDGGATKTPV